MKHIIITPAKNEEKYIEYTLRSVVSQTLLPIQWIIVDDDSIDDTVNIVNKYAEKYKWITLVQRNASEEERAGGGKVVRAFNEGYKQVISNDYDFITKLDADLTLPDNYFEEISKEFRNNSSLGICGGVCYIMKNNELIREDINMYHVRGALKSVRKDCFADIDGFMEELHWDGIDEFKARYHKWDVYSIEIQVIHHRPTSKAYNPLKLSFRNGYAARRRRATFLLSFMRAIKTLKMSPYLLNFFSYLLGFIVAVTKQEKNILGSEISRSMNRFHYLYLFNKKKFKEKYMKKR